MDFFIVLFLILVIAGWQLGKVVGGSIFGRKKDTYTFIDKSVHHHHHTHEHKNISIIDDATKKKIFELKESKEKK